MIFDDINDIDDVFEAESFAAEVATQSPHQSFQDYMDSQTEKSFKDRYRMKKQTFIALFQMLNFESKSRGNFFDPRFELLALLRYLATGSFMEVAGDLLGVSKSASHRAIHRAMRRVCLLASNVIKMPSDFSRIKLGFRSKCEHFEDVIGAVDGTHVRVKSPGGNNSEIFRNRKGYFSINVQAVCDHRGSFTDVVIRWPGSTHDARIFDNSVLKWKFEAGQFGNGYLLPDSGYALKDYCITPYLNCSDRAAERFNKAHSALRIVIGRAFGMLKRRFPALSFGIRLREMEDVCVLITAAFVLHNICMSLDDDFVDDDSSNIVEEEIEAINTDSNHQGTARRDAIKINFA